MNREEFIAKLQMVYVGDRNAIDELVGVYDNLKGALQTHEILLKTNVEENQRLKENNQAMQEEMARTWKKYDEVNNVLNELKKWFKEFHKYQSRLKWNEEDYIEFIEHLENELKESNDGQ